MSPIWKSRPHPPIFQSKYMTELVSIEWLSKSAHEKDLVLLDASLAKTAQGKSSSYQDETIPGSRYFDLKGSFSDTESAFPNTLPTPAHFERACQKLGINQNSRIVVFDNMGIYSSPRVWWMFKVMGHERISVLDGGLPAWIKAGHPTVKRETQAFEAGNFNADFNKEFVKHFSEIQANVKKPAFIVVDARSEGRFNGTESEPRKQLQSGHIPGSVNIPFQSVLSDGKYKPQAELKRLFEEKCQGERDLVFSCGSGLTACIVMLASELAFKESRYLYDGSWTEWAKKNELTIFSIQKNQTHFLHKPPKAVGKD